MRRSEVRLEGRPLAFLLRLLDLNLSWGRYTAAGRCERVVPRHETGQRCGRALMSNKGDFVNYGGGDLHRVLATLYGFKAKHGSWPTELLVHSRTVANLRSHLTDLGFEFLTNKVTIAPTDEQVIISRDGSGRTLDYDSERDYIYIGDTDELAEAWLGFETGRPETGTVIPEELIQAIDDAVPKGVSHIGFVATNIAGEFLITEPKGHPYGVNATFSKVRVEDGERPSDTLARCIEQQVGQGTISVFPIPAVWITPNSTGYYFAGMLWNEGAPPSEHIAGLQWLPRGPAEEKIRGSHSPASRARDLGLIEAAANTCLSPYRRMLLMVLELHHMGFERLRAPAYGYPLAWRCPVVPAAWTYEEHGGRPAEGHIAHLEAVLGGTLGQYSYSAAAGQQPFGWTDVAFASPRELARKFVRERREIALAGWGPDPNYAAWFRRVLEMTEPNGVIAAFLQESGPSDNIHALMAPMPTVPTPPPGSASEAEFERFGQRFGG